MFNWNLAQFERKRGSGGAAELLVSIRVLWPPAEIMRAQTGGSCVQQRVQHCVQHWCVRVIKACVSTLLSQREVNKKVEARLTGFPALDKKGQTHTHARTHILLLQVTGVTQLPGRNPVIPPDRLNDRLVSQSASQPTDSQSERKEVTLAGCSALQRKKKKKTTTTNKHTNKQNMTMGECVASGRHSDARRCRLVCLLADGSRSPDSHSLGCQRRHNRTVILFF